MTAPLLSVVVPVYNAEAYLEGCLDSIEGALASLPPAAAARVEVIVSENHSNDASPQILADHPLDCMVVIPEDHLVNRTDNWNFGLRAARGKWRMMLHADDLLVGTGLERLVGFLDSEPVESVGIVFGQHQRFTDPSAPESPAPHWRKAAYIDGPTFRRWSLGWNCPFPPFIAFRGQMFEDLNGFDGRFELVQDWDFWLRATSTYDLVYIPAPFGSWRSHPYGAAGSRRFAGEQLQIAASLTDRYGIENLATHLFANMYLAAKARRFVRDEDLSTLADRRVRFQPGSALAILLIRAGELVARAINHFFRVRGSKRFPDAARTGMTPR